MSKCFKYNCWKPSKKRSAAQMQVTALMKSHTTYQHAQNKENIAPLATTSSSASAISNTQLEREKKHKNTYQSHYRNKKRCHEHTKSHTNKLQSHLDEARASMTEASLQMQTTQNALATTQHEMRHLQARNEVLTRHNCALAMRASRAPLQKAHAVDKALARTAVQSKQRDTFSLKEKNVVHQNHEIDVKRKKHCEASSAKLAAVVPCVTPDEIAKMRVVDIDLQIRWHRQFDVEVPAAKHLKGKNGPQKKAILTAAVGRYVCGGVRPKIQDKNVMDGQQEDAQCAMGDSDVVLRKSGLVRFSNKFCER
ncbi:uncharacterized protein EDB93DRAFT_1092757 [Suillus bovinus]|uniref:uncharacterized protein n=1 Tax=Suillus bovinus TaxID=48563 RepID=UPI001B863A1C|nr:uncharacterized protein EDB93DRAFT_1092757 [Suillus bovinus]KAG2134400.1 hypothetical protein EDB93DRAFT_1092757 [Suillus bovinus]